MKTQAVFTELDQRVRAAAVQRLRVGVGADELNALHALADHVLDGIAAAAAHAHHLDAGTLVELFDHFDRHLFLSCVVVKQLPMKGVKP